jgi:hypothetical protein
MEKKDGFPNITLEQAKELIGKWQRQVDVAIAEKHKAMNIAFDFMYPDFKIGDIELLKSQVVYFQSEMKNAIKERDKAKQRVNELIAENNLLKIKLRGLEKEEGHG